MKKIVRLTEADLYRIVKRVINEQNETINFNQTVQLLNHTGNYVNSLYIKTITTRGKVLDLNGTDPTFNTPRNMIYHCTLNMVTVNTVTDTQDKNPSVTYKFGPQTETKMEQFCKKSMGTASTQKPGNTSSVA